MLLIRIVLELLTLQVFLLLFLYLRTFKTRNWLTSILFLTQLAFQIHTNIPQPTVRYIELIKPITQPRFPDRTQQALEAKRYNDSQALIKQQQAAAALLSTQAVQAVYTAPTVAYNGTLSSWLSELRSCESGGNYAENTGNGYYGAYQFSIDTWNSWHTGYSRADLAPASVQDATIIKNTLAYGLASQNPGCYASKHLSTYPPN